MQIVIENEAILRKAVLLIIKLGQGIRWKFPEHSGTQYLDKSIPLWCLP